MRRSLAVSFVLVLVLVLAVVLSDVGVRAEDTPPSPYPPGPSSQPIEGLQVELVVPRDLETGKKASLIVILHGAGGTATGMAGAFRAWADDGYVVCAPKSVGQTWSKSDLDAVLKIARHLEDVLPIDPDKVHVVGFSNGGWNLAPIAFDDDLHPCSASWIAAGFQGHSIPKWAREHLGALALAGSDDPNKAAARATVDALMDKVRSVEVRVQPGIGHALPEKLLPYMHWWTNVMEGRFEAGDDQNFDWGDSLAGALAKIESDKKGGVFVYVFDPEAKDEETKELQGETFMDPIVRFYGNQLQAVKLDKKAAEEQLADYRVKLDELPAVIVLSRTAKSHKLLSGRISARKLQSALKKVAPEKKHPYR